MKRVFTISKVPPSVNTQKAAFAAGGKARLIKTKKYREWIAETLFDVASQPGFDNVIGKDMVERPFLWSSEILFPCNVSNMDLDNVPKAIHDLLVTAGKVPDDRYLVEFRVRWSSGNDLTVTVIKENLEKWGAVKKLSKPIMRKLAVF